MAEQARRHDQVLSTGEGGLDGSVLAGETDAAADGERVVRHVDAVDAEVTARRRDQCGDGADEGGLARTVGSEDGEHLAAWRNQIESRKCGDVAETYGETGCLEQRRGPFIGPHLSVVSHERLQAAVAVGAAYVA